jgi:hypothetical protein
MTRRILGITACGLLLCLGCNIYTPPETTEPALEETAPIVDHRSTDPATVSQKLYWQSHNFPATHVTLLGQHNTYVQDFISRPNFGGGRMVRMPMPPSQIWEEFVLVHPRSENTASIPVGKVDYVSGQIYLANQQTVKGTSRKWYMNQHQLVSTNTAAGPAAYTMTPREQHEFMKSGKPFDGSKATKRKLDEFELTALERVKNGAEVVSQETGNTLRVFGAIKARKDCLACHQHSNEGDLLGSFTYSLNLLDTQTPEAFTLKNLNGLSEQQIAAIRQIEANSGRFTLEADGRIAKLLLNVSPHVEGNALNSAGRPNYQVTLMHHSRDFELSNLELFPDLLELDVSGSLITDAGLEHLKPLTKLRKFTITNTRLTKAGIDEFRKTHTGCVIVGAPVNQLPLPNTAVAP